MTSGTPDGGSSALELRRIVKRFGAVVALDDVDFTVSRGTVHALLGENGAGKSTLMRVAYGLESPDEGDVRVFGIATAHGARSVARAGAGMVHQHLSLVPSLTAMENLALGDRGRFQPDVVRRRFLEVVAASGLEVPPESPVRELSIVEQQRLEILKALARGARLLILDEPTAMLGPAEVEELLGWIRSYASQGGSVVLVTHKLREALAVASEVTVLRRGRVTYHGPSRANSEQDIARAMFPESLDRSAVAQALPSSEPVVVAEGIRIRDARGAERIRGASFRIGRREIVGMAAIEGAGHRELLAALAGIRSIDAGQLQMPAQRAFIPADRLREALIPEFSLTENVALRLIGDRTGLMPWRDLASKTAGLLETFSIRAPSTDVPARALSGGNQQRLVVARELDDQPDLVVADNPTRGLDIRATNFVHDQFRQAAARGAAVVFHSSDLDEILAVATRVLVVFHGEVRELPLSRDEIGRAMLGTGAPT